MLQAVHQENAAARASSIFCRWIREERGGRVSLVVVWMDSAMRCFEQEFVLRPDAEELREGAPEQPGGAGTTRSRRWTSSIEIPSNLS